MTRRIASVIVAALFVASAAGNLSAQGRGGGRGGGGGHQGAGPVRVAPGPPSAPRPAFAGRAPAPFAPGIVAGPRVNIVRPAPRVIVSRPGIGFSYSPFFWGVPAYSSPAYIASPTYVTPAYLGPTYVAPSYAAPAVSQNEAELSYQVQRLSQEIESLRQQQSIASQQVTPVPLPPAPEVPAIPAVLIFRDGRRVTVQNYAIVGQTLWIIDENASVKISLSELDLDATQKENQSKGVRFSLPRK